MGAGIASSDGDMALVCNVDYAWAVDGTSDEALRVTVTGMGSYSGTATVYRLAP